MAYYLLDTKVQQSNVSSVYLEKLDASSAGTYSCEVDTDHPHASFPTTQYTANLTVPELLYTTPALTKDREIYQVGDTVHLNCASRRSKPAPELTLFVYDLLVNRTAKVGDHLSGLQSVSLRLALQLTEETSRGGPVRVKCQAGFGYNYATSSGTSVLVLERTASTPRAQPHPSQHECLAKAPAILAKAWASFQ
ncbi:uncharacterized protein LOC144129924 [Amblyomma americanum]